MTGGVTTSSIDYLQRTLLVPGAMAGPCTTGVPATRRLLRVRGIGRHDKERKPRPRIPDGRWRAPTTGLITGLYGYRIPLAFSLVGMPDGVRVQVGTWSTNAAAADQDRRREVIGSVLQGLYPVATLEPTEAQAWDWSLGGLAVGVPAPTGVDEDDGSAPIDRVIRSLVGTSWQALVLAYPMAEVATGGIRAQVLNEMRAVETAAKAEGGPSPLAEQYVELLQAALATTSEGLATGAWRTSVYLLGDGVSYPRLAAAWRSVFSGEQSVPEPVRVFDRNEVNRLAQEWAMPDDAGAAGPGHYQRPFDFQTMLSSAQLAAYAHLPEQEVPGFVVEQVPRFDAEAPPLRAGPSILVGKVLHNRRETGAEYRASLLSLTRHVFVAGVTGSGKTNTIFSLLAEADRAGVPFLVVEPAKREYRALIEHPVLGPRLRVFTAGQAGVSPLLLNPFEVPTGTSVSEHLDLIRAAFSAAFGMWTPLPQILERCLHEVYVDRGWDLRTNGNARLTGALTPDAFPTLADLVTKVGEVIPTLGYEEKVTGDMKAALVTRLESLRTGGKGAMLDVARSLPPEELLGHPTVIELEAMGDEGDKAFLAALLLIRLAEHRRSQGQADRLVHLLVVEEAHRLLSNVPTQSNEESANPRGQAVETFSNLLSEIRAYGQGVVIADQVPVRLAPDVVKNTNLKIAHRTVSADDRSSLGGAMAMEEAQTKTLTTLGVGEAAVLSAGDDSPLLVRVPLAKDPLSPTPPSDDAVAQHMAEWRASIGIEGLFLPRTFCAETCAGAAEACEAARRIVADEYVQRTIGRVVMSTIEEAGALDRLWRDVVDVLRPRLPRTIDEAALLRAFAGHASDWYAQRRGAQGVWTYTDTADLQDRLRAALLDKVSPGDPRTTARLRAELQAVAERLHVRTYSPYQACEDTCTQGPPLCLYRSAVAALVASGRYQPSWREADAADAGSEGGGRSRTWEVCENAAFELIEFPVPDGPDDLNDLIRGAAKRVGVCFEQQMLADDKRKLPRTSRRVIEQVLAEAEL